MSLDLDSYGDGRYQKGQGTSARSELMVILVQEGDRKSLSQRTLHSDNHATKYGRQWTNLPVKTSRNHLNCMFRGYIIL